MRVAAALCFLLLLTLCQAAVLHQPLEAPGVWRPVTGLVNMGTRYPMIVALRRRNLAKLEQILLEVSDPRSMSYGNHLTHDEMRTLVSPGTEVVARTVAWLKSHGANDIVVARHEDSIKFTATAAQISKLLSVQFHMYENPITKERVARALGAVHVPDNLVNDIELVAGHRGFPLPKERRPSATDSRKDVKARGPWNMNVTPAVLYSMYNETDFPPTPAGVRNIQSFFQAQGQYVSQTDLTSFCQGLMPAGFNGNCNISKYIGGTDSNSNPGLESSLDSQYITATGYGLETWVYTYNGDDFCQDLVQWGQDVFGEADGTFPFVISMSYGSQRLPAYCTGDGLNRIASDTMKMGAMGISVIIASGDNGSGEWSRSQYNWGYLGTSFPAELPHVTAVGSTTFEEGNSGTERAASFSGGGFSFNWVAPTWQQAAIAAFFANNTQLPPHGLFGPSYNASGRGTPDVSVLGENFYVIDAGTPTSVAGTSCSTPSFAGMVARLNNIRLQNNKTLGFINPLIYQNPQAFTDIVTGTNDMNHDRMGWYCTKGWDPVTGLGTPVFSTLASVVASINQQEIRRGTQHKISLV